MQNYGLAPKRFEVLADIEEEHFWFVARRALITGLLRRNVTQKMPVLVDLGCGPGHNLSLWIEFADQVIGIDQHPPKSAQTAEKIIEGDVTCVPMQDASTDVVLLLDVLEHVDDVATLAETFRILKPGGLAVLSVPAHPWLWGARDVGASHLRRYSRRALSLTVRNSGLQVARISPYQFFLLPAVILSRLIGKFSTKTRDMEDRPSALVNRVLGWVNGFEAKLSLSGITMPTGSSYVLVARKAG